MHLARAVRGLLRKGIHFSLMGRSLWGLQARLCPAPGASLRLLFIYGVLIVGALSSRKPRARRLRIRAAGRDRDWWVADPMEVAALWTVFVAGEYGDWLPQRPRFIVDAGANVGSATLWFRERFPDARIVALEPNPSAFERLRRNLGDEPNVRLVNAALADRDGRASFALAASTSLQGRLQDLRGAGAIEVDVLTLATVRGRYTAEAPIDLLKLNIEGAEWPVLAGSLTGLGTVVLEIHEPVPGDGGPDAALRDVAKREGFELRQGYSQALGAENLRWLVRPKLAEMPASGGVPA